MNYTPIVPSSSSASVNLFYSIPHPHPTTPSPSAQRWSKDWGSLYAKGDPLTYDGKISKLQAELSTLPSQSLMTNNMMSYHGDPCFKEPTWQNHGKKTFGKFETFGEVKEELDPKYKPSLK